ncbi:hypothetical protein [Pediococcus pentosaceus]|nr:hypothetical protein [Pediococcus pentosaceus]
MTSRTAPEHEWQSSSIRYLFACIDQFPSLRFFQQTHRIGFG